ncbi:MAG: chaperone NapD [Deltaproteobacteria bacterium]|nr:chaperone NapD [Deltaproteobacteria bacterium]
MAILGFLVHTEPGRCAAVEQQVAAMPEMTTYGIHQDCYVVAVAEAPSSELEAALGRVGQLEGVLTCYVTGLTTEDEQEER